jgi:peptidoglycan/LPS O-acetylase OafA/YrhL
MPRVEQRKSVTAHDEIAASRWESVRALKRYGLLSVAIAAPIGLVAAGMPGHFLWRWVGVPLILAFLCTAVLALFHGSRLLWDWLESLGK